ncbi:hypothetical protein NCCP2716_13990 [Sporosarcina sp. NCCP-2716]|nr:hypothetical protein NCCP2716_13990 [Sporosarcina sp. NCCP-2716]
MKSVQRLLITNYLNDILLVLYSSNKGNLESWEQDIHLQNIINKMQGDIGILSPVIQAEISTYSVREYLDHFDSDQEKVLEFRIIFYLLCYIKEVSMKANVNVSPSFENIIHSAAVEYAYLAISTEVEGYDIALNNLRNIRHFNSGLLNVFTLEEMKSMIEYSDVQMREVLIDLVINTNIDMLNSCLVTCASSNSVSPKTK